MAVSDISRIDFNGPRKLPGKFRQIGKKFGSWEIENKEVS
jgi:hypothetical protein